VNRIFPFIAGIACLSITLTLLAGDTPSVTFNTPVYIPNIQSQSAGDPVCVESTGHLVADCDGAVGPTGPAGPPGSAAFLGKSCPLGYAVAGVDSKGEFICSAMFVGCVKANGLMWCYNNSACGEACNDVCASIGLAPIADNNVWFQAQDSEEECIAISQALGLGNTVDFDSWVYGCLQDSFGAHYVAGGVGLVAPLMCSRNSSCPSTHRTEMGQLGEPCGLFSRRSICPCE
jgi:hypothetical protein